MRDFKASPRLVPREYKDGSGWYVEASREGHVPEHIGRFESDSEAYDWISLKSTAYFAARNPV
jgi:hypothetical protein